MHAGTIIAFLILLALAIAAYALHRFALYLESRDLIYYLRTPAKGGGGYNPLQEFVQPQICHVEEAREQRLGNVDCDPGAPPNPSCPAPDQPSAGGN